MFYRKDDVDEAIICGMCDNIYKDPRVLPCGESACHECIELLIKSDTNKEFLCNFCQKTHTYLEKEGFISNCALMKLLKAKAETVYRNAKVEELKKKLVDIKSKCEEFKLSLENGVDQVREHCIRLRNQVHLETDMLIEEVLKFNESLIADIEKYEQECIHSFNINKAATKENGFDKFICELDQFYHDKSKYLTNFYVEDRMVKESVAKADIHLNNVDKLLKKLQFNGKVLEFRKRQNKIDKTLLGTLFKKSLGTINRNVDKLNELKLTNDIIESCNSSMHLFSYDNGNNFAFYLDDESHLNLTRFDNNGHVVEQVLDVLDHHDHSDYISELKVSQSLNYFIFM
jgi:hypothetical protein